MSYIFIILCTVDLNCGHSEIKSPQALEDVWVGDWVTGRIVFESGIIPDVENLITPSNGIEFAVASVQFADSHNGYFVKFNEGGDVVEDRAWTLDVRDDYPIIIDELTSAVPDFNESLRTILFGHGGTHIYVFETGIFAHLEGETNDEKHPLHKTITEQINQPGTWTLMDGSALSLHRSDYFLLKFRKLEDDTVSIKWCLPDAMTTELNALLEICGEPDEAKLIADYTELLRAECEAVEQKQILEKQQEQYAQMANHILQPGLVGVVQTTTFFTL